MSDTSQSDQYTLLIHGPNSTTLSDNYFPTDEDLVEDVNTRTPISGDDVKVSDVRNSNVKVSDVRNSDAKITKLDDFKNNKLDDSENKLNDSKSDTKNDDTKTSDKIDQVKKVIEQGNPSNPITEVQINTDLTQSVGIKKETNKDNMEIKSSPLINVNKIIWPNSAAADLCPATHLPRPHLSQSETTTLGGIISNGVIATPNNKVIATHNSSVNALGVIASKVVLPSSGLAKPFNVKESANSEALSMEIKSSGINITASGTTTTASGQTLGTSDSKLPSTLAGSLSVSNSQPIRFTGFGIEHNPRTNFNFYTESRLSQPPIAIPTVPSRLSVLPKEIQSIGGIEKILLSNPIPPTTLYLYATPKKIQSHFSICIVFDKCSWINNGEIIFSNDIALSKYMFRFGLGHNVCDNKGGKDVKDGNDNRDVKIDKDVKDNKPTHDGKDNKPTHDGKDIKSDNKDNKIEPKYSSESFWLIIERKDKINEEIKSKMMITILNQDKEKSIKIGIMKFILMTRDFVGIGNLESSSYLRDADNGFCINDTLSILVDVTLLADF